MAATTPAEDAVAPATWIAREPEAPWCPEALLPALDATLVTRASTEPCILRHDAAPWRVLGASVRGRSHAHRGDYRDDAIACASAHDVTVLAVADGAGSSRWSRVGAALTAQIAVDRTIARFAEADDSTTAITRLGTAMANAVHDAAMRLHALAADVEESPAVFRTTLLLVAISGDLMLVSQVGDGAVLVQRTDGSVVRIGAQRETAWAGEVTCFVPDACAMTQAAALRQVAANDVRLIVLMSDGIDDPFHPLEQTGDTLVGQWTTGTRASIGTARQPECGPVVDDADALLTWMSFEQRGEVDDRSLLLAWRPDAPPLP